MTDNSKQGMGDREYSELVKVVKQAIWDTLSRHEIVLQQAWEGKPVRRAKVLKLVFRDGSPGFVLQTCVEGEEEEQEFLPGWDLNWAIHRYLTVWEGFDVKLDRETKE